jgi:hypothetical protein
MIDQNGRSIGIVQMYNLTGMLSKMHIERFKAFQGFLGGCINNIGDFAKCIKTMIGVTTILGDCQRDVERIDAEPELFMFKFKGIHFPLDQARVHTEKLLEESLKTLAQNQIAQLQRQNS